jgi:hypothetical protein
MEITKHCIHKEKFDLLYAVKWSSHHENIPGHTQYCVEKENKEME